MPTFFTSAKVWSQLAQKPRILVTLKRLFTFQTITAARASVRKSATVSASSGSTRSVKVAHLSKGAFFSRAFCQVSRVKPESVSMPVRRPQATPMP